MYGAAQAVLATRTTHGQESVATATAGSMADVADSSPLSGGYAPALQVVQVQEDSAARTRQRRILASSPSPPKCSADLLVYYVH